MTVKVELLSHNSFSQDFNSYPMYRLFLSQIVLITEAYLPPVMSKLGKTGQPMHRNAQQEQEQLALTNYGR